jgi:hypothetical protein
MAEAGDEFLDASEVVAHCYENCTKVDSVQLIGCDGHQCDIEWFHIECVGLTADTVPDKSEKWFCPSCVFKMEENQAASEKANGVTELDVRPKGVDTKKLFHSLSNVKTLLKSKKTERVLPGAKLQQESKSTDYSWPSLLHLQPAHEKGASELEEINRRQRDLELEIAKAKLESTQAELAALKGKAAAVTEDASSKTDKKTGQSDIKILLEKLFGKDEDDASADEAHEGKRCKKKDKSGLYKKASDDVKVAQSWPHLSLCLEYSSRNISFKELSLPQFVAGEIEIMRLR